MAITKLSRLAPVAFQLAALLATSSLAAQAAPPPPPPPPVAADPSMQTPREEVPQMQLEEPTQHVVAPPPVRSPEPAPATFAAPPPEQAAPPACDQSATPSPCTQPRNAYRHDGFYLRMTQETQFLGFFGKGPEGSASVKGLGTGGMLALGGTPVPGLVIAGMLSSDMVRGKFKGRPPEQDEESASMSRAMLGVLVDWYPQAYDGWHVGAALGFAGITLSDASLADSVGAAFSAKLFGGYDWWIGPEWSLGVAAVFATTPSTPLVDRDGDKNGYRFYTLSAGLAWSLTLH